MASFLQFLSLLSLHWLIIIIGCTSSNEIPKPYIVYMGSWSSSSGSGHDRDVEVAESSHLQLLSSIIPSEESERISLIHHYHHVFKGFSAMLTDKEASALSGQDDVVSVFPDPVLELHTTRSWDFVHLQPTTRVWSKSNHKYHQLNPSSDVIIGVIDTGIWPESESFKDTGISKIPSRWKGTCMESSDFKKSLCNRKLIGVRYYNVRSNRSKTSGKSARDWNGHGTHVASTAAGARVDNVSYYGLARGMARGGSPSSRIAVYKACSEDGTCEGSAVLKAIVDAINDGVDIISMSIGNKPESEVDFLRDPTAIGAFYAEQNGVMFVCSAGNDGPRPHTVGNTAPWIFTVAASSIDRDFHSPVLLGNGKTFPGASIHFSKLSHSKSGYPLAFGKDIAANLTTVSKARSCGQGSLDPKKVAGKIIVCIGGDPYGLRLKKGLVAAKAMAKGLILVNEEQKGWTVDSGLFPYVEVSSIVGSRIIKYITSTKNPTATILPTVDAPRQKPAPVIAYFSSRGPGQLTQNIIKPDITAPGVNILAAVVPKNTVGAFPIGQKPPKYAVMSGTSMACPHVTGAAAFIKSVHHHWTSSMIKSALMTTATPYDNLRKPMTNNRGHYANPHDMGAGEINPLKALNPGLVFETTMKDHFNFLCYFGYPEKHIRDMLEGKFKCPKMSSEELISNINYPSISIGKLDRGRGVRTVRRSVTNVGTPNATYTARVHAPSGLLVKVLPEKLAFSESGKRVSFKVAFHGKKEASAGYKFGSITWSDGPHSVRMVFAVNVQ